MFAPNELHVFDLDDTLYRVSTSVRWGPPGFDKNWILPVLSEARRSLQNAHAVTALLTGRPDNPIMRKVVLSMLDTAGLHFDRVQLKPLGLATTKNPLYKAFAVKQWLLELSTIDKVVLFDDDVENLAEVCGAVESMGIACNGYLVDPKKGKSYQLFDGDE